MARAYYSTVIEQPADDIWRVVRDFNAYSIWVDGAGESAIEDGKSGDTVGAIRSVSYQGSHIRQRLLAQSDVERSQTYEFCGAAPLPVTNYQATLRMTAITEDNRSFVEWWATFDCEANQREQLTQRLAASFATWLGSLRRALETGR
jgi:hypothetical protein